MEYSHNGNTFSTGTFLLSMSTSLPHRSCLIATSALMIGFVTTTYLYELNSKRIKRDIRTETISFYRQFYRCGVQLCVVILMDYQKENISCT